MKSSKKKRRRKSKGDYGETAGNRENREIEVKTAEVHTEGTLLLEAMSMRRITVAQLLALAVTAALMALLVWLLPLPPWAAAAIAAVPLLPLHKKLQEILMLGAYLMRGETITIPWALAEGDALILDGKTIPFSQIEKISFMEGDELRVFSPLSVTIKAEDGEWHFRTLRDGTEEEIEASENSLNDFGVALKLLTDIKMEML